MNSHRIEQKLITLSESDLATAAHRCLIRACGFDLKQPKDQCMMREAEAVLAAGGRAIRPRGILGFFPTTSISSQGLDLGNGIILRCDSFSQMAKDAVCGAVAYVFTIGRCLPENPSAFLYADLWGTAYVDAGSAQIREEAMRFAGACMESEEIHLSSALGPGYYGMPIEELPEFGTIFDLSQIGVSIEESGVFSPEKTRCGIYLLSEREELHPRRACETCQGSVQGCQLCTRRTQ